MVEGREEEVVLIGEYEEDRGGGGLRWFGVEDGWERKKGRDFEYELEIGLG
jgi:hypothetical protein